MHAKKRSTRLLAALAVTALVVVTACGDDDDATAPTTTSGSGEVESTETTAESDTTATTEASGSTTTEASPETTEPAETAESAPTDTVSSGVRTAEENGEPVKGGTLVYGLEADTANGWAPYNGRYVGNLRDGVEWARYLRVLDPCVAQGAC